MARGFMESRCVEGCFDSVEEQKAFTESIRGKYKTRGKYAVLWRNGVPEEMPGYVGDVVAHESAAFIERHHAEPFFLYVPHDFPHVPVVTDEKYLKRVANIADAKRRDYAAMMLSVDDAVGQMLAALRKHGIEERTLIFFMSDNGGPSDGRLPCFNTPFTGNKGGMSEGGIRVPYFVQWKGTLSAGKVYGRPVSTLDIVPTALAAAGIAPPADVKLDGVNLLPFFKGAALGDPHERLYWRYLRRDLWAVREGDWKLRHDRSKREQPKLYDLSKDLAEATDLATQFPARVKSLQAAYEAWAKDLPKPRWSNEKPEK